MVQVPLAPRIGELAARIEAELPELIVAVRHVQRPDGEVQVIFLVARISEDPDLAANINARYIVDSVKIAAAGDRSLLTQGPQARAPARARDRVLMTPPRSEALQDRLGRDPG